MGWNEGHALCDVLREIMTRLDQGKMASQMASLRADNKRCKLRFMMLAGFGFLGLAMTFVGIFVAF